MIVTQIRYSVKITVRMIIPGLSALTILILIVNIQEDITAPI